MKKHAKREGHGDFILIRSQRRHSEQWMHGKGLVRWKPRGRRFQAELTNRHAKALGQGRGWCPIEGQSQWAWMEHGGDRWWRQWWAYSGGPCVPGRESLAFIIRGQGGTEFRKGCSRWKPQYRHIPHLGYFCSFVADELGLSGVPASYTWHPTIAIFVLRMCFITFEILAMKTLAWIKMYLYHYMTF